MRLFSGLAKWTSATELDHLQSAKADGYHLVNSEILERSFHVYVQLPREYNETDQRLSR